MPPAARNARNSNWRSLMGIMIWKPHLEHGVVVRGCKSPGMNTLAPHPPQVTMRNCLRSSLDTVVTGIRIAFCVPTTSSDVGGVDFFLKSGGDKSGFAHRNRCPAKGVWPGTEAGKGQKKLTMRPEWCCILRVELKMSTTFKHKVCAMSVKGQMSIWHRDSRCVGNVGGIF